MRKQPVKNGTAPLLPQEDAAGQRVPLRLPIRRPVTDLVRPPRALVDDFAEDADTEAFLHASGRNRRIRRGLIPQTRTGRIAAGVTAVAALLTACAGTVFGARFISTDPRFSIPSSRSIEIDGNNHLTRSQMLSVFGEDIDRNIFSVSMEQRRTQLEQMPWVEHATVMRLLPNRLRVHVTERVPVAFVREGSKIGLVDANGVLLDIPPDSPGTTGYTFPVVTGMRASETAEERAEQMKLYAAFLKDLDSDGKGTSALLSEIDLSDPEDARALIPDHNSEIMVHFGHENFLARYKRFQEHIAEWRSQYPRLSNVDMRYERQVVLQMPPRDAVSAVPSAVEKAPEQPVQAHVQTAFAGHVPVLAGPHAPAQKPFAGDSSAPGTRPATVLHLPPARSAKPPSTTAEKDAAMRRRVEAIRAWMAQREKARAAARSRSSGASSGALDAQ